MAPTGSRDRDKNADQKAYAENKKTKINVATNTNTKPEAEDVTRARPAVKDKGDGQVEERKTVEQDTKLARQRFQLNQWNNLIQHYYCRKCLDHCDRCSTVRNILDHKTQCRQCGIGECSKCQQVKIIEKFHKDICKVREAGVCLFCLAIDGVCGEENTEPCTVQVFHDPVITHEITPIKATSVKGMQFFDEEDYKLDGSLGRGGNGEVFGVQLSPPGQKKLGMEFEADNLLAAKIANVKFEQISVLKELANCPYIAPHYFILHNPKPIYWQNRRKETKLFKHLMFMKRAATSLLDHRNSLPGRVLGLEEACHYFRQMLQALSFAHNLNPPIVHNDFKPGNVLLYHDGLRYCAWLTDFEFATRNGIRRGGTSFFMAPKERGELAVPADDIFSAGATFLELTISRDIPDKAAKVKELKRKHMGLGFMIGACLQKHSRPTADDLLKIIDEIAREEAWWSLTSARTPALK